MGWTWMSKPLNVKGYLRDQLTGEDAMWKHEVLDIAIVAMRECYAAVKRANKETGESYVFAAVILLDYRKGQFGGDTDFGYKDMDESMGPYVIKCPARILDLLTPTTDATAFRWREMCRKRIAQRTTAPRLKSGDYITWYDLGIYEIGEHTNASRWRLNDYARNQQYVISKRKLTERVKRGDAKLIAHTKEGVVYYDRTVQRPNIISDEAS